MMLYREPGHIRRITQPSAEWSKEKRRQFGYLILCYHGHSIS